MKRILMEDETLDDLQLKGIKVIQKKHAFRFGVDAVLLANFAKVKKGNIVVDLCTGTGIVPFILAGKTEANKIIGVEIQEEFVDMGNRTIEYNKLENRVEIINGDLKDKNLINTIEKADVVTVNPPYKISGTGIVNENDKSAIARHEIFCNIDNVIEASKIILKDNGRLYMIHRPERIADIMCSLRKFKMEPKSIKMIHSYVGKAPSMILIEAKKNSGKFLKWEDPLYIYDEDRNYTKEINQIYGR